VRRQHTANKQNAVDQAICTKVVEESHGQRREEYVENRYAASVAECRKHSCCLSVLVVAVRIHPVFCICNMALVPGVQGLEVQVRVSNYVSMQWKPIRIEESKTTNQGENCYNYPHLLIVCYQVYTCFNLSCRRQDEMASKWWRKPGNCSMTKYLKTSWCSDAVVSTTNLSATVATVTTSVHFTDGIYRVLRL
jgi:hypothetical protein